MKCILALLVASVICDGAAGTGASVAGLIGQIGLDPNECYRVRDVSFQKEDIRIYLNDGHLLFAKSTEGRRLAAVFLGDVPGGDAEVIIFPPHTSERVSLASFIKSPNLNEHFSAAVFLFSDDTAAELLELLKDAKKDPDAALMISGEFNSVIRNIASSYLLRLLYDMLSSDWKQNGMFFAALSGKNLGNFDILYDPRAREQILAGQLASREDRRFFNTWTSFPSRSIRNGARKPLQDPFSLERFTIDARLNPDLNLHAKTGITVRAKARTDRVITLDLSRRMKVTEVRLDGQPVEYFASESLRSNLQNTENDTFLIVLPKPLEAGESCLLEVTHEGRVVSTAGNGVYYVSARNNWYPSREGAFSFYDLSFRYPKNLQLLSTGDVVDDRTEEEWRVTRRKVATPIRFAGFNLGDYEKASQIRAGFTIDVYANRGVEAALQPRSRDVVVSPSPAGSGRMARRGPDLLTVPMAIPVPDPKARLRALADEIGGAMEFMNANFGPPPLKTLTVSPIPGTFGQGFPGLLYLSTLAYIDPADYPSPLRTESQRRFFSELLHAHEVAHQWWGNLVVSGGYQDDWLMEALANYSALMFLEKRKGRRALEEVLDEFRQHLLAERSAGETVESAGPIVLGTRLNSSQTANSWRTILYEKGAWILHMLRARIGDAAFMKMLNALAQRNHYGRMTTDGFRILAAEFIPKGSDDPQLEGFFEQWVYGTGIPSLKLTHSVRGKAPKVRVAGSVAQADVNEDFSIAIPIEIQMPGKRSTTKWVRTSNEPTSFTADLTQAPTRVSIDPYAVLMSR